MVFNHIYYGVFVGSTVLGITGLVQWWNSEGLTKSLALTVGVAGTTSALVCTGLGMAYSTKHQSLENETSDRINQIEAIKNRELTDLKIAIDNLKSSIKVLETQGNKYIEQIVSLKDQLNEKAKEYFQIVAEKELTIKELEGVVSQRDTRVEDFLSDCRTYTVNFFSERYKDLSGLQKLIENARHNPDVPIELRNTFDKRLEDIHNLKTELNEAIEIARDKEFQDFGQVLGFIFTFDNKFLNCKTRWKDYKVKEIKTENRELKQSLDNSIPKPVAIERFTEGINEVDERITEKYEALLLNNNSIHAQLLDLLEKRNLVIDELQRENEQLRETLDKPYHFYGTSSIPATGNKISEYYYRYFRFKLDCLDWQETEVGYRFIFSIGRNPGITLKELEQENSSERLAALVGAIDKTLPKIEIHSHNATVSIEIQTKLPVKQPLPTIDDIFRECAVIRADKFCQVVSKHHIDQKNGKPTLRVMSATSGGKSIAVKNLLDYYLKNIDGYEIWLSDPQDGSSEDYWDCQKTAINPSEATALFNQYAKLLKSRDSKTSTLPDTPILGVFDEFDKKHPKEDKQIANQIWTTIRHHQMRLMLIGQSGEVARNGWQWDEMTNCALLFITDAIPTFLKHAVKDLGMNVEVVEKFERRYNKAKKAVAQLNEDIDTENIYRLAALYCGGKVLLLEIPEAHKGELVDGKSWIATKPFEKVSEISTNTQNKLISNILQEAEKEINLQCPECNSLKIIKKGKTSTGKQQYGCKDCGKKFTL